MSNVNSSALKSQNNLRLMFIAIATLDIILVIVSKDLWAIGRIIFTIGVMHYALQGQKWAKWVLISIFSLVVVLLTAMIIVLHSKLSTFLIIGSLILIAMIIFTSIFMLMTGKTSKKY